MSQKVKKSSKRVQKNGCRSVLHKKMEVHLAIQVGSPRLGVQWSHSWDQYDIVPNDEVNNVEKEP